MQPYFAFELKRDEMRAAVHRRHATNSRIFGSVLYGTDQEGSDVDLLIEVLPGATIFDLGGLRDELESLLGVPIELVTPADLPPAFRGQVLAEAKPI